jgi:FtsZ-interacting cell division protein ZipA
MNWFVIVIVGIIVIALVVFTIFRNQKDKNAFEQQINNDYPKEKDAENDVEIDEEKLQ